MNNKWRKKRIKEIPKEIAALTQELDNLLEIQEHPTTKPIQEHSTQRLLAIGDLVVVLSKQAGLCGTEAKIIGATDKRYILQLASGSIIYRAKHNVTKK